MRKVFRGGGGGGGVCVVVRESGVGYGDVEGGAAAAAVVFGDHCVVG